MEKKKNIITILGRDRVGVKNELMRFTSAFRERQSDLNIEIIDIGELSDISGLQQKILSVGLFVEKRLFVLKGNFEEKSDKKGRGKEPNERAGKYENLVKILENIDDETFIVIVPDSILGEPLMSWLTKYTDMRKFDQIFSEEVWKKRFTSLPEKIVNDILKKYERLYALYEEEKRPKNISYLINESFEKLSLLEESQPIGEKELSESMLLESSGRVFDLIDAILSANRKKSLELFRVLQGETQVYMFLPSFIGLLRSSVYVKFLKVKGYTESEIIKIMKIHPFVVKKAIGASISWEVLRDFYDKIVSINIAYRSGKGLHDPELGRIFGIERALMSLKK